MSIDLQTKSEYSIITLYEKTERVTEETGNENVRSMDEVRLKGSRLGSKWDSKRFTGSKIITF